jgi:hypothetical protein
VDWALKSLRILVFSPESTCWSPKAQKVAQFRTVNRLAP